MAKILKTIRIGSRGGGICLTADSFGFDFNTRRMPWCHIDNEKTSYGINPNENFIE